MFHPYTVLCVGVSKTVSLAKKNFSWESLAECLMNV